MDISEAIVACEIKVDICNQLNKCLFVFFINTKGQGH